MPAGKRNSLKDGEWELSILETSEEFCCTQCFDCGDPDLNEFFSQDAIPHREELLAETYVFRYRATENEEPVPVAFISFCNDTVEMYPWDRKKFLPEKKAGYKFLPAVKIARLGVLKEYHCKGVGTRLLNLVKKLFITDNRTGCRFLTVDAYNRPEVISFYQKNDFQLLSKKDREKLTRTMYFDLKRFRDGS